MFNHFFSNYANVNSELYQKIFLLSNIFEESFKEIDTESSEKKDSNTGSKQGNKNHESNLYIYILKHLPFFLLPFFFHKNINSLFITTLHINTFSFLIQFLI